MIPGWAEYISAKNMITIVKTYYLKDLEQTGIPIQQAMFIGSYHNDADSSN
jgi:hypothetical protein